MYLVSSGFSFKLTSSSSSSSLTQFSQEWARRKVVIKHSIQLKIKPVPLLLLLLLLGTTWPWHFTPICAFRLDVPVLSRVCSPNNVKVGIRFLCLHSRYFGSYFDQIVLMYLVSYGFSFKPISSSSITPNMYCPFIY